MSHISKFKTEWVDAEILLLALRDLGYPVEQGELKITSLGGEQADVEIKVRPPLSAEIGFRRRQGKFEIVADWFSVMGVKRTSLVRRINQRYAYHAARQKLEEQGFYLVEEKDEAGKIHLLLRRMA
ncbi:hypothetical protein BECAL_01826 [Bellilinea caldifistulae]|uniref:DUF1257 domain-containing protein n=1 Tax=Bellilinea caldifistulae TaxID=360411 RepID=A0A0P6XHP6_9CHLR|nr:DUF1257 domain-containing protein [Bellilinea caldifistulae]KPL75005.1 hypothetical protein AC812_10905 [Bellilinea caldifistulae]GAP10651.1 hypothetical protein BECAL_01826 [Bellilinea caldifistulae]